MTFIEPDENIGNDIQTCGAEQQSQLNKLSKEKKKKTFNYFGLLLSASFRTETKDLNERNGTEPHKLYEHFSKIMINDKHLSPKYWKSTGKTYNQRKCCDSLFAVAIMK